MATITQPNDDQACRYSKQKKGASAPWFNLYYRPGQFPDNGLKICWVFW